MLYKHKNRISFRKVEYKDLILLKNLKDESWFGTHQTTIVNDLNQKEWFEKISRSYNHLYLLAYNFNFNDTDRPPVGIYKISNIDWINRCYDSAYDIFLDMRKKGYGKSVMAAGVDFGFEVLNMHRVNTEVLENNIASYKNIVCAGFIKEGLKRKSVYKCNEWINSIAMGILKEDWQKLDRVMNMNGCCNLSYKPTGKISEQK